jgi:asparagine synthetase B (glutamine-hydrolysing)
LAATVLLDAGAMMVAVNNDNRCLHDAVESVMVAVLVDANIVLSLVDSHKIAALADDNNDDEQGTFSIGLLDCM